MKLIHPSYKILTPLTADRIREKLQNIEVAGRVCYKSEDKIYWNSIDDNSAVPFIQGIIKRGHESVIEHESISIKYNIDLSISHELVRHRIASYSQSSTRYISYLSGCTFIIPSFIKDIPEGTYNIGDLPNGIGGSSRDWLENMLYLEKTYIDKLSTYNWTPQQARSVLPKALQTEVVCTMNLRELRHMLKLRTANAAHPDMRSIMRPLLAELKQYLTVIFNDITY